MSRAFYSALAALVVSLPAGVCFAQQSNVGTPFHTAGSSYRENIGVSWGLQGPGWFFNFGGPAPMPFGGNAGGATLGGGFRGGNVNGFWRLTAGQSSDRSLVAQAPGVTTMNGGTGFVSDTTIRPFVTGWFPVVGGIPSAPPMPRVGGLQVNPLRERLARLNAEGGLRPPAAKIAADEPVERAVEAVAAKFDAPLMLRGAAETTPSSADAAPRGVAAIRAERAAAEAQADAQAQAEIDQHVAKAQQLIASGKPAIAKHYYRLAAQLASGAQQQELQAKFQELDAATRPKGRK